MDLLPVIIILYLGANLLAFAVFLIDKLRAQNNLWRIPENTLLGLAIIGPFGALGTMVFFRHKTRHTKFLLVPIIAFIHAVVIAWICPLQGI